MNHPNRKRIRIMASKKAQVQAQNSPVGQLAAKGLRPTEIAQRLGMSTAKVYRTLEVAEGFDPTPYRGTKK
jgi:DNA-binding CsgD family transcriptional regulator